MLRRSKAPDTLPSVEAMVEADVSRMYRADGNAAIDPDAAGAGVGNLVRADVFRMYRSGPGPVADAVGAVAGADVPPEVLVEADVSRMYRTVGRTPRPAAPGTGPSSAGVPQGTHPAEPRTPLPTAMPDARDVA